MNSQPTDCTWKYLGIPGKVKGMDALIVSFKEVYSFYLDWGCSKSLVGIILSSTDILQLSTGWSTNCAKMDLILASMELPEPLQKMKSWVHFSLFQQTYYLEQHDILHQESCLRLIYFGSRAGGDVTRPSSAFAGLEIL